MKRLAWGVVAGTLASTPAAIAGQVTGPDYSVGQIRAFTVAGVRLGMNAEEAAVALKSDGYEDQSKTFADTNSHVGVWVQVDRKAMPFRSLGSDGALHTYRMIFEQRFEQPQSIQALSEMVAAKYGKPTETDLGTDRAKLTYHTHFTVVSASTFLSCALETTSRCLLGREETTQREADLPTLTVTLSPTLLRAEILDVASMKQGEAAAEAGREMTARSNSASTKLGL